MFIYSLLWVVGSRQEVLSVGDAGLSLSGSFTVNTSFFWRLLSVPASQSFHFWSSVCFRNIDAKFLESGLGTILPVSLTVERFVCGRKVGDTSLDSFFQMNSSSVYPPCFLSFNSFNFLFKNLLLFRLCVCLCVCVCMCALVYLCLRRPEVGVGPHDGAAGTLTFPLHISNNSIFETYPYTSNFLIWLSSPFTNNFHLHFLPLTSINAMIPSVKLSIVIKDEYFFCNSILYGVAFWTPFAWQQIIISKFLN